VFTGGIGENAPLVREKACQGLAELGYEIDLDRNREAVGTTSEISTDASRIRIFAIPTNEELLIARDTFRVVRDLPIPS
jgi:acetate kinase